MPSGLQHMIYEEGLRELCSVSLEKSRLMGNLVAVFNYLMGGCSKDRDRLFQRCTLAAGEMPAGYLEIKIPVWVKASFMEDDWPKPWATTAEAWNRDLFFFCFCSVPVCFVLGTVHPSHNFFSSHLCFYAWACMSAYCQPQKQKEECL